jgi:hypothetical protein
MGRVDPNDDNVKRWIVLRYAYDPERHERRHQVVAAFDNQQEFMALIEARRAALDRRRDEGEAVHPLEYFSGVAPEPGYRRRMAFRRLEWEVISRGVALSEEVMRCVDWRPEVGFFWSAGGGTPEEQADRHPGNHQD